MSGEFTVKRNCAQSGVPYLTFDGLTDDSMCFEYLASSALLTPKQVYSTACKDYYVQGGDGKKTVSSYDICNAADKPNDQVKIVDHLKEIKSHTFSSEMHRLSEALAPLAIAATELREQEGYKWRRFEYINSEISTAKKALCINDGYKKKTDDDGHVANAYNECREEDSGFWKNLWSGIKNLHGRTFRSLFMSVEDAEKTISRGMQDLQIKDDEHEVLLMMYLPNILRELIQRKATEENLFKRSRLEPSSPLRNLPPCDLQLIAYFKSVVPTLSFGMVFGQAQVRQYTGGRDFMDQAFKVLGNYEINLGVAAQNIEEALKTDEPNDAMILARETRAMLDEIPRLGDPKKLNEATALLDPAGWKNVDSMKTALSRALKNIRQYEKNIAAENANDMSSAINAMIFMIDAFAKRTERREFGKVLLATLWMNAAVDATDSVRRSNAIARAKSLLKEVSLCKNGDPCNLNEAERRWFKHINRLLVLLSAFKGSNLGCLEGQVQEDNQCWDTAQSCIDRVPSEAFDASSRMCMPCEDGEHVKVTARNEKGEAAASRCARNIRIVSIKKDSQKDAVAPKPKKEKVKVQDEPEWGGSNPYN